MGLECRVDILGEEIEVGIGYAHAGRAAHRARVRARADEIEAIDFLAAVVRAEPGALREHRFHAEGRAAKRQQIVLKILRRQQA